MTRIAIDIFINVFFYFCAGFWLTYRIASRRMEIKTIILISTVIGYVSTTIIGTWLTALNVPVISWWVPWVCLNIIAFIGVCFYLFKGKKLRWEHDFIFIILGWLFCVALVAVPAIIGKANFMILRGNGTDSFNYITMAEFVNRTPYWQAFSSSLQQLINLHPSFELAKELLSTRWSTSMLLAFTANLVQEPIYTFDYQYSILFLIFTWGPAFLLARKMNLVRWQSILAATTICVGFWGLFVLDIRAESQLNSLPLILVMAWLVASLDETTPLYKDTNAWILVLCIASLFFLYAEMIPIISFAFFIYFTVKLLRKEITIHYLLGLALIILPMLVISFPFYLTIKNYLSAAINYAANGKNAWDNFFFSWFFQNPLIGFWGLSPFNPQNYAIENWESIVSLIISSLVGVILTFLLFRAMFRRLLTRAQNFGLVVDCVALSGMIAFEFLLLRDQYWSAGKALAYVYPFFILLAVSEITARVKCGARRMRFEQLFTVIVVLWMASQVGLSIARIADTRKSVEFNNYPQNHGSYRQHDWAIKSLVDSSDKCQPEVWSFLSEPWYAEYIGFAFQNNVRLIHMEGVVSRKGNVIGYQTHSDSPQCILYDKQTTRIISDSSKQMIAGNTEIELDKVPVVPWAAIRISNLNGVENWGFWLAQKPTKITIYSSTNSDISLKFSLIRGPYFAKEDPLEFEIKLPNQTFRYSIQENQELSLTIPVAKGITNLQFIASGNPSITQKLINDPRSLFLGISNFTYQIKSQK